MMSLRTNRHGTGAAATVWLAGFAAAAGLVYALDRPLTIHPEPVSIAPPHPSITEIADRAGSTTARVLEVPTVVITAHRARPRAPEPRPAPSVRPRDISEMNCSPWRDLEMGSGRVQVCE